MVTSRRRFGLFEIDLASGELWRRGVPLKLPPQPSKVLSLLVSRAGELVSRDELSHHVWGDAYVDSDQGLNNAIRQIRVALDDRADAPTFLETVPRRGYRFIATLETEEALDPAPSTPPPSQPRRHWLLAAVFAVAAGLAALAISLAPELEVEAAPQPPRVAVLPLRAISNEAPSEMWREAVHEEVITELARHERLAVIGAGSTRRYAERDPLPAEVASQLEVGYVLEGSVRIDGEMARIAARLVDAEGGHVVWSERYARPRDDPWSAARQVSRDVAKAFDLTPPAEGRSISAAARQAYLEGRFLLTRPMSGPGRAIEPLQEAVRLDPSHGPAHAALAHALIVSARFHDEPQYALQTAERAVSLAPDFAEAHAAAGMAAALVAWNFERAAKSFEEALRLAPGDARVHNVHAFFLSARGEHEAAVAAAQRALQLDPVSPVMLGDIGLVFFRAGDLEEAQRLFEKMNELAPEESYADDWLLDVELLLDQRTAAAQRARRLMHRLDVAEPPLDASPEEILQSYFHHSRERLAGIAGVPPSVLAQTALRVGEIESALDHLEQTVARRQSAALFLSSDPRYDALRENPRFARLVAQVEQLTGRGLAG